MPDLYEDDVKEKQEAASAEEEALLSRLFEYTEGTQNPWRADYIKELTENYQFVELNQWTAADEAILQGLDVPAVPVDRINRGLDTINGIRKNSNLKKRIVKREQGDERVAKLLDLTIDQISYDGDFEVVGDDVFDDLTKVGIGIKKLGFDPEANGGQGAMWCERVDVESFGYSKAKNKDLSDISWCWHHQVMSWEDAMMIAPEKAGRLKGMRTILASEWEKNKGSNVRGASRAASDYGSDGASSSEPAYKYPDSVDLHEFWVKRRIPLKRIGFLENMEFPEPNTGEVFVLPIPRVREEPIEYEPIEGEEFLGPTVRVEWNQYIVAGNRKNALLLKHGTDDDHPFVGYCAKRKKSGAPIGYVEIAKPHQRRINLAWAQKIAFNNKAIKAPLVIKGAESLDLSTAIQSSTFGSILKLPMNAELGAPLNQIPNVNLQAIEEGNVARADMDFAAAATEEPLRGVSGSGDSGIKLSLEQNAAITPLNVWVTAYMKAEKTFMKKVLRLVVQLYPPDRIERIVGSRVFAENVIGPIDPLTQQPVLEPLQFPLNLDLVNYDVVIEDQAISDFNKQQSFNATEALAGRGVLFDDEFRIKNAPIKNVDEAIASNRKAKQDLLQQLALMQQVQPPQASNAVQGATEPQNGQQSLLGGQRGL